MLMVTHDPRIEEYADTIIEISDGKIIDIRDGGFTPSRENIPNTSKYDAVVGPTDGTAEAAPIQPVQRGPRVTQQSLATAALNHLKKLRKRLGFLPGCDLSVHDLGAYALRDARESWLSLVSNVVAIFMATLLTGLMVALLVGIDGYIYTHITRTPDMDSVHVWTDYSTRAEPVTREDYLLLQAWPNARFTIPNIHQVVRVQRGRGGDTIVNLVSTGKMDPETARLQLVAGDREVDPGSWQILLNSRVAAEIKPLNPKGLIGDTVTIELRLYDNSERPDDATPSEVLLYPVRVVGIVKNSPEDRVYGSVDMLRAIRDTSTFRSTHRHPPEQTIDVKQVSAKTMYESVRVHFADADEAEQALASMKEQLDPRFDVFWRGSEMAGLQYIRVVAIVALVGAGILATLAGSISIFNTLLAAMFRKTSEIGLLRALGLRKADIFLIFMLQSVIIGVLASIIGLSFTWLVIVQLNNGVATRWPGLWRDLAETGGLFVLSAETGLLVGAVVVLICALAGFLPAFRAAQKNPMDALRGHLT